MRDYQAWSNGDNSVTLNIDNYGAGYCIDIDGDADTKNLIKHELDSVDEVTTEWNRDPRKAEARYEILTVRARHRVSTQTMVNIVCDKLSNLGYKKM
jgi:hypothetical protein